MNVPIYVFNEESLVWWFLHSMYGGIVEFDGYDYEYNINSYYIEYTSPHTVLLNEVFLLPVTKMLKQER